MPFIATPQNDNQGMLDPLDPDLHLVVDGEFLPPFEKRDGLYRFKLDGPAESIRIASRTNNPARVGSKRPDRRRFGVAINHLVLRSQDVSVRVRHSHPLLTQGFYEQGAALRWTDGDALIPKALFVLFGDEPLDIVIKVVKTLEYPQSMTSVRSGNLYPEFHRSFDWGGITPPPVQVVLARGESAKTEMKGGAAGTFYLDADDANVQHVKVSSPADHFEGIAFSRSGKVIAIAAAGAGAIFLYRRQDDGHFEDTPFHRITGREAALKYPHDVSFATVGNREYLASTERRGTISLWAAYPRTAQENSLPTLTIGGPDAAAGYYDSISSYPGAEGYLAAGNFADDSVNFFRLIADPAIGCSSRPQSVFRSPYLCAPDGIAFSACGAWLACSNHFNHTVSVFQLQSPATEDRGPVFDPVPVMMIRDPGIRFPHSLAFCPGTNDIAVTSAGSPYVNVYAAIADRQMPRWSSTSVHRFLFCPVDIFEPINSESPRQGGGKGIAIHGDALAICSPEMGFKIYKYGYGSEQGAKDAAVQGRAVKVDNAFQNQR